MQRHGPSEYLEERIEKPERREYEEEEEDMRHDAEEYCEGAKGEIDSGRNGHEDEEVRQPKKANDEKAGIASQTIHTI